MCCLTIFQVYTDCPKEISSAVAAVADVADVADVANVADAAAFAVAVTFVLLLL